jgi:hypothetical protein
MAASAPHETATRALMAALRARDPVTGLSFYVAEAWYLHEDKLTFGVRGLRFRR